MGGTTALQATLIVQRVILFTPDEQFVEITRQDLHQILIEAAQTVRRTYVPSEPFPGEAGIDPGARGMPFTPAALSQHHGAAADPNARHQYIYYRFGGWLIWRNCPNHYMKPLRHAAAGRTNPFGRDAPEDIRYHRIMEEFPNLNANADTMRRVASQQLHDVAAAVGTLTAAWFLAEVCRNRLTLLSNLLVLDLIDSGGDDMCWSAAIGGEHPMSAGGRVEEVSANCWGGSPETEVYRLEIDLAMRWLNSLHKSQRA